MTKKTRYTILESLPSYGPMYIPVTDNGEPFYSEGFVVKFHKSDGTDWVANFKPGWTNFKEVHELKSDAKILVIANGTCYLMNPDQSKPLSVFGVGYVRILETDDHRQILQDQTDLTIIETNGEHWITERISWDGLADLKLENNLVTGLAYDPTNAADDWVNFAFDINTRILTGGSFKGTNDSNLKRSNNGSGRYRTRTRKKFTPYFCPKSIVDVILPSDKIELDETKEWAIIGWPGVDGIQFRVKSNDADSSVFAFYPIEQDYVRIADSDRDLIEKWKSGHLTV